MFLFWKDYSVPISENCGRVKVGLDHQKVGHGAVYNLAIGPGVKSWLDYFWAFYCPKVKM